MPATSSPSSAPACSAAAAPCETPSSSTGPGMRPSPRSAATSPAMSAPSRGPKPGERIAGAAMPAQVRDDRVVAALGQRQRPGQHGRAVQPPAVQQHHRAVRVAYRWRRRIAVELERERDAVLAAPHRVAQPAPARRQFTVPKHRAVAGAKARLAHPGHPVDLRQGRRGQHRLPLGTCDVVGQRAAAGQGQAGHGQTRPARTPRRPRHRLSRSARAASRTPRAGPGPRRRPGGPGVRCRSRRTRPGAPRACLRARSAPGTAPR